VVKKNLKMFETCLHCESRKQNKNRIITPNSYLRLTLITFVSFTRLNKNIKWLSNTPALPLKEKISISFSQFQQNIIFQKQNDVSVIIVKNKIENR